MKLLNYTLSECEYFCKQMEMNGLETVSVQPDAFKFINTWAQIEINQYGLTAHRWQEWDNEPDSDAGRWVTIYENEHIETLYKALVMLIFVDMANTKELQEYEH